MGEAFVSCEGKTKAEAMAKMTSQRETARKMGFIERAKDIIYDEGRKLWVFIIWFHS